MNSLLVVYLRHEAYVLSQHPPHQPIAIPRDCSYQSAPFECYETIMIEVRLLIEHALFSAQLIIHSLDY
jgi:hypothetical protein